MRSILSDTFWFVHLPLQYDRFFIITIIIKIDIYKSSLCIG